MHTMRHSSREFVHRNTLPTGLSDAFGATNIQWIDNNYMIGGSLKPSTMPNGFVPVLMQYNRNWAWVEHTDSAPYYTVDNMV